MALCSRAAQLNPGVCVPIKKITRFLQSGLNLKLGYVTCKQVRGFTKHHNVKIHTFIKKYKT
jgi:hypothetical protein